MVGTSVCDMMAKFRIYPLNGKFPAEVAMMDSAGNVTVNGNASGGGVPNTIPTVFTAAGVTYTVNAASSSRVLIRDNFTACPSVQALMPVMPLRVLITRTNSS